MTTAQKDRIIAAAYAIVVYTEGAYDAALVAAYGGGRHTTGAASIAAAAAHEDLVLARRDYADLVRAQAQG